MNREPNGQRRAADPRSEAARRAYIEKRRKQIRRNRILLGAVALVLLALVVFLVVLIGKGIAAAIRPEEPSAETESASLPEEEPSESDGSEEPASAPDSSGGTESEPPEQTEPATEDRFPALPDTIPFRADLSAYEQYMNPEDRDGYLILVNPDHPLDGSYAPTDLTDVANPRYSPAAQLRNTSALALKALFLEMAANGYTDVTVTSGYRSYQTQNQYFEYYVTNEMSANPSLTRAQAEAIVMTYSCRAGTSEHQSGLACDMHNLPSADISFARQPVAQWLADNAWKCGFILRFPEDKTDKTGISYEPWHFRFVGREHAYRIHELGLCLEEYIELLNS
ncbi:MAG: D-alanyl-D-alanine carboxypeptidase family protein [Clostridia bacterium]|nr:D-alanyl-D-alanine carboxypeptidase family protein [Clostridia bacterium]